ncbi:dihydroneopterin aldolase [Polycladomyces sp. WAk]|uniref:7,8-dihydroneopterin aldolase n=1 Tax=Polycladomyces zharkentensis TaxID=2807616 RepID=A0ABS2WMX8_9BACL|nr:dihydroneopterin aldolase [Polycladomyces sp. WAk]
MDKIFFRRMQFYGYHGVYSEENKLGQRFYVDLELMLDLSVPAETDDLNRTVDYAKVYETVRELVEERTYRLVESLAESIAQALLAAFPVEEVWVRVTKPDPPIPGHYDAVGVEIRRKRR